MTAVLKTGQFYGNILQKSAWSGICLSEKATLIFPCGGGLIARTTIARLAPVPSDHSTSPGTKIVFSKGAAAPKATLWRRNSRLCILPPYVPSAAGWNPSPILSCMWLSLGTNETSSEIRGDRRQANRLAPHANLMQQL